MGRKAMSQLPQGHRWWRPGREEDERASPVDAPVAADEGSPGCEKESPYTAGREIAMDVCRCGYYLVLTLGFSWAVTQQLGLIALAFSSWSMTPLGHDITTPAKHSLSAVGSQNCQDPIFNTKYGAFPQHLGYPRHLNKSQPPDLTRTPQILHRPSKFSRTTLFLEIQPAVQGPLSRFVL